MLSVEFLKHKQTNVLVKLKRRHPPTPPPPGHHAFDFASCLGRREFQHCLATVAYLNQIYLLLKRNMLISFFSFCKA